LYQGLPEERRYAIFAAGLEKAPSLSFFANANSPIDNISNDFTCSTTLLCDNTDEASVSWNMRLKMKTEMTIIHKMKSQIVIRKTSNNW